MTMQAPPTPRGWDYWFMQCSDAEKEQLLTDHGKATVALYKSLRDLLWEAVAGKDYAPAERLLDHAARPQQRWEMYRQLLPQAYDAAQKDFHALLERAHSEPAFAQRVEELQMKREAEMRAQAQVQALAAGGQPV